MLQVWEDFAKGVAKKTDWVQESCGRGGGTSTYLYLHLFMCLFLGLCLFLGVSFHLPRIECSER